MTLRVAGAGHSIIGARSGQEDAFGFWPADGSGSNGGLLALVSDGMGGHRGGAIASNAASSEFLHAFGTMNGPIADRLGVALQAGNAAISREIDREPSLRGMGCTLVAAWLDDRGLSWISVGDSLLLLCRYPNIIRLNADHSLGSYLDEQAKRNQITEAEARENRHRNALRSALTGKTIDLVDLRGEPIEIKPGDWLLMASDGIFTLSGDEIGDIVFGHQNATPQEMAQSLTAAVAAKNVAEQDNTTVIAVHVSEQASLAVDDVKTRIVRGTTQPMNIHDVVTRRVDRPGIIDMTTPATPVSRSLSFLEQGLSHTGAWVWFAGLAAVLALGALLVYSLGGEEKQQSRGPSQDVLRETAPAQVPTPPPPSQARTTPEPQPAQPPQQAPEQRQQPEPQQAETPTPPPRQTEGTHRPAPGQSQPLPQTQPMPHQRNGDQDAADLSSLR